MKVSETIDFDNNKKAKIQFAEVAKGGNSSWGEKEGYSANSIRLSWYNENGKFDPYSSSEVPIDALKVLLQEVVKRDMYSKSDLADMIGTLTSAIYRK